jgi:hypothetical protein
MESRTQRTNPVQPLPQERSRTPSSQNYPIFIEMALDIPALAPHEPSVPKISDGAMMPRQVTPQRMRQGLETILRTVQHDKPKSLERAKAILDLIELIADDAISEEDESGLDLIKADAKRAPEPRD